MIQEEPDLRALISLPPPSAETLRQLESPSSEQQWVTEPGFPAYETIRKYIDWLAMVDRRLARVRSPKLPDDKISLFDRLDRLAHIEIPAAAVISHAIDLSLGAIDGAGVRSPLTAYAKTRKDGSARSLSKDDEHWHGRRRLTTIAGSEAMIVASLMTTRPETIASSEELLPTTRKNLNEINRLCIERGHRPATIPTPVIFGDTGFNYTPVMQAAHNNGFDALFRHRDYGLRHITNVRTLRSADGGTIDVVVCSDGAHLCPCQWTKLGHRRTPPTKADAEALARLNPMEQLAGRPHEHVEMRCIAPDCHLPGRRYRVSHPKLADGTTDLTTINRIVRWDKQNQANLFKATQNIERMHASLDPSDPDPDKTTLPPMTRMLGDAAAKFGSLLADLRMNLYILDNLDHHRITYRQPDIDEIFNASINKTRGIFKITRKELPTVPRHHLMDGIAKRRKRSKSPPPALLAAAA
jgi:hypothetical protein